MNSGPVHASIFLGISLHRMMIMFSLLFFVRLDVLVLLPFVFFHLHSIYIPILSCEHLLLFGSFVCIGAIS
jgi:hypothetical protein